MGKRVWGEEEEGFIRERCGRMTDEELTEALNREFGLSVGMAAVRKQRQRLGLAKRPGRGVCGLR